MPVRYRVDKALKVVFSTAAGQLSEDDLLGHQRRLRADPAFDPGHWQLYDLRDADLSRISPQCIALLAQTTLFKTGTRRALVVGDDLAFGLARMFAALREGSGEHIRVFRDMGAALTWLELD